MLRCAQHDTQVSSRASLYLPLLTALSVTGMGLPWMAVVAITGLGSTMKAMRVGNFRWAIGVLSTVIGAMMLVVPHQFASPVYSALQASLPTWGLTFLATGLSLIAIAVIRAPGWVDILAHVLASVSLLTLAYSFVAAGTWISATKWAVLGLASLAAAFPQQPGEVKEEGSRADLLVLSLGAGAALTGLTILALPGQFAGPIYDSFRSSLPWFGWGFLGAGLTLSFTQLRTESPALARSAAQVLVGALFVAYLVEVSWPLRAWTGIGLYGGMGLILLALPWVRSRIRLDGSSLDVRLALALSSALVISNVLLIALVDELLLSRFGSGSAAAIAEVRELSFLILVLSGLTAAGVGIAAARWLAAPLRALSRASERLAAGDRSAPLPASGLKDVSGLALAFGEMREKLAERTAERERLLAEVKLSEERFRFVATNIPDTLFFQDEELRYVWIFNPSDPFGKSQVVGKTDADLLPPDEAERLTEIKRKVLETGTGTRGEIQLSPGGTKRWYEAVYEPSRDLEGRIVGIVSYSRDIAKRKRAEEALRESEERLRTLADAIPQLVWMARPDGSLYWYNQRWYEYTGTTPEQMEGWGWQSVHDPEMLPEVLERWRGSIATGEPFDMEFPLRQADGRFRWFLTRIVPLKDSEGRVVHWFGTNTDITERREVEAQRERLLVLEQEARRQAEAAVKVRDEFISVAAHELKTPVTSLSGFAQLITRQIDRSRSIDPERLAKALRQVVLQSGKLTQLTEQLLDLSRLESGRLVLTRQEVDLGQLVQGAVEAVQHAHPERVLELLDGDPILASVDPLRIEQVITNLLDNAIKFSPNGSPVLVEVASDSDGWAEVAVRDYGIGIPRDEMEQIFEPFHSAHPERHLGGMGIGLHIARQMAEVHGGSIRAELPEGGGSCFVVRLPVGGLGAGEGKGNGEGNG